MSKEFFDFKVFPDNIVDLTKFFKLRATIRHVDNHHENTGDGARISSINLEESKREYARGTIKPENSNLFSLTEFDFGKVKIPKEYVGWEEFEKFVGTLIKLSGVADFSRPDPPDFLVEGIENAKKFNSFFSIHLQGSINKVSIEAKYAKKKTLFFSQKSYNNIDEWFLEKINRVRNKENVHLTEAEIIKLFEDFIIKKDALSMSHEYVLFNSDEKKNINIFVFDREEFIRTIRSSKVNLLSIRGKFSNKDKVVGCDVIANGKKILTIEFRTEFVERLEQENSNNEGFSYKEFMQKLIKHGKILINSENSFNEVFSFLRSIGIDSGKISVVKNWFITRPKVICWIKNMENRNVRIYFKSDKIETKDNTFFVDVKL